MSATNRGCNCGCKGGGSSSGCGDGRGNCAPQGDCASECCQLECLVRPNFFCGQLLTDADLGALVDWTRKRFALSRYKDGWGIVCGLDVTCSPPEGTAASCCDESQNSKGPFVWLTPGYAIDCCGNDLVVCDPLKIDLSSICRPPYDPCDPRPQPVQDPALPAQDAPGDNVDPCFTADRSNLFAVQASLRHHEDLAQGQRAMFRSGGACGDTAACEYARVLERPCVHLECIPLPVAGEEEPDEVAEWLRERNARVKQLIVEISSVVKQGPDAVLKYLRTHPPYQACYLRELVCCLRERNAQRFADASMVQLGLLLVMDRAAREIGSCNCFDCKPDGGIPLGTVILRRSTVSGRTTCTVYEIDPHERYRRYLRKEICQRLQERRYDLTKYVGQPVTRVAQELRATGVTVEGQEDAGPTTLDELAHSANAYVFSIDPTARQPLRPQTVVDPLGTARIIGFVPR